jgi:hypothetical protein
MKLIALCSGKASNSGMGSGNYLTISVDGLFCMRSSSFRTGHLFLLPACGTPSRTREKEMILQSERETGVMRKLGLNSQFDPLALLALTTDQAELGLDF